MEPVFFATPADFRKWLQENYETATELIVGFYKKSSGKPSITWPESVEQALCFGWIDGIRRSRDEESYTIRFTPRRPGSIWSAVNINKMEELKQRGLVLPAGLTAYDKKSVEKSKVYSFEQKNVELSTEFQRKFKANKKAWSFFQSSPPSYRRPAIWWVMSAKREETRASRLKTLIEDSENGLRIKQMRR